MTRVPTLAQAQLLLFHTLNTKARVSDLQTQLATGKVSQDYAGIPRDALRLVSLEGRRTQIEQYLHGIDGAVQRIKLMDLGIESIDQTARDFRALLEHTLAGPDAPGQDLKAYAANLRDIVADLLNTRDGTRYLFGGTRTDRRPVQLDAASYASVSLIESDGVTVDETFYQAYYTQVLGNSLPYAQGSFYDQIFFEKNGVAPSGPLPADPDNPTLSEFVAEDPDLWQYYVDRLNSSQMLANPKVDYYQGDANATVVRADAGVEVSHDIRADDLPFQQVLAALDAVANLPAGDANDTFERAVIVKARDMLNAVLDPLAAGGADTLDQLRADLAGAQQTLERTRERHVRFDAYAEGIIHDLESIDQAEVITRLQGDQQALESAYAVLVRLHSLSLLEFL